jgi:hypothetical protein
MYNEKEFVETTTLLMPYYLMYNEKEFVEATTLLMPYGSFHKLTQS